MNQVTKFVNAFFAIAGLLLVLVSVAYHAEQVALNNEVKQWEKERGKKAFTQEPTLHMMFGSISDRIGK